MKKWVYLIPASWVLSGCAVTQWMVENEGAIDGAADTAGGFGPYGAIASLVMSNALTAAKWYEGKKTTKEVIKSVQKSKDELPPEAKKLLKDALVKHTPSKIKDVVAKVKKKL